MQDYKNIDVYKISHELSIIIHKLTLESLPKFEMFEEGAQIRRSAKSISSLIVEGFGRKIYQQEYLKFITYAIASCDETKEHLELLYKTGSLKDDVLFVELLDRYKELGRKLYHFRESIRNGINES